MQNQAKQKGRSSLSNDSSRFLKTHTVATDDEWGGNDWDGDDEPLPPLRTTLQAEFSKTALSFNESPDVPFDRSTNPYRGCEHGCIYCFARPSHAYMDLSPGLDFESQLFFKPRSAELLRDALSKRGYRAKTLAIGVNTDCYQPTERKQGITRQILELMLETRHPCSIISKSSLIERDLDLLAELAKQDLIHVGISLTTLDKELARRMEPRAASPKRRLQTMRRLSEAGVPVTAMVAPLIPVLNDKELETLLWAAKQHGADAARYILLRLPKEVAELFAEWLQEHYPLKAEHVMKRIRDCRGGKNYDSDFSQRMRGSGVFADLIEQRFQTACKRLDLNKGIRDLRTDLFHPPAADAAQLSLF